MTDPDPNFERPPTASAPSPPPALPEASQPIDPQYAQPDQLDQQPEQIPEDAGQQPQQPQPPQPFFQPLFTLVTDTTSRATHHPRIHYIFSDDDPDILTEELAQYSQQHAKYSPAKGPSPSGSTSNKPTPQRHPDSAPTPGPNDRAIVLDLVPKQTINVEGGDNPASITPAPAEYEVAWASSLSADWAVISAKISPLADETAARSASDDDGGAQTQQRLMLRIEGVDIDGCLPSSSTSRARYSSAAARRPSLDERDIRMSSGSTGGDKNAQGGGGVGAQQATQEDYDAIVDEFDKRMGMLRKVIDAGLERQRKVAATAEGADKLINTEAINTDAHSDWGGMVAPESNDQEEPAQRQADQQPGSRRASEGDIGGGGGE